VIKKVTQAMVEVVHAPKENVRAWIYDLPKESLGIAGASAKSLSLLVAAQEHLHGTKARRHQFVQ
jgi:hypothetical protein